MLLEMLSLTARRWTVPDHLYRQLRDVPLPDAGARRQHPRCRRHHLLSRCEPHSTSSGIRRDHRIHRVWLAGCLRDRACSSRQQLQARPGAGQRVPGQSIPTASTAVVNFYHSWRNHRRLLQVRRVAKEMDVEKATAAWVIRDVTIGRDCEFSPARSGSDGA